MFSDTERQEDSKHCGEVYCLPKYNWLKIAAHVMNVSAAEGPQDKRDNEIYHKNTFEPYAW